MIGNGPRFTTEVTDVWVH